jgi:hypothetical protein
MRGLPASRSPSGLLVVIGDLVQQGVTQSDYSLTGATTVIRHDRAADRLHRVAELPRAPAAPAARWRADPHRRRREGARAQRQRMTVEDVEAEARQQQIGPLEDVRFAVLETNRRISFATR